MHNQNYFTSEPTVISKAKESYSYWLILHRNIPKTERFSLGQKISNTFLLVLKLCFIASYSPADEKLLVLKKVLPKLDILKFFIQIAWENKLIATDKYAELSKRLEEIGRMLGGWRSDTQKRISGSKTPAE